MLGRFVVGTVVGFGCSLSSAWCESPSRSGILPDGLKNFSLDGMPIPRKEELEYVKTWGVPWVEDWDRPGARGIRADRRGSCRRQIILVRHGQYQCEDSDDDRVRTLTTLGEQQSRLTGEYLANAFQQKRHQMSEKAKQGDAAQIEAAGMSGEDAAVSSSVTVNNLGGLFVMPEPKFVHVSDMTRAQQTAKLILEAFPPSIRRRLATDATLRERYPCDPEPPRRHRHASYSDMQAVEKVFEKYFHRPTGDESSVEIIVGHANVIRYLVCRALQLPPEAWLRISLPHCSITSIVIRGSGHVSLSCLGSAGHLPVDMVTTRNIA
ncbi:phosphoglycerate mutase family member 5 [Trypanosoma grayi]|uniref:phosphoglycerate mutase family member 5 n=1 Tax=Trypanosoma grayi TaxID=71804 RepID=UPI0004F48866|nr:phosphoglycerate mutase family member 5 [Trypanosoma grayi]KEG09440.1 phosphoglycerate mutase family member 5 [Trypanosoma grayi]